MIVNRILTMITSCNKVVNLNYVAISVAIMLSEQLFCNWHDIDVYDHATCIIR